MQIPAYNDSIIQNRYKTKYMAIIDLDEFLVPVEKDTVFEVINELELANKQKIAGIGISWLIHGFNGHYEKKQGLLTELYPKCEYSSASNYSVKSIVNPRSVFKIYNAHFSLHVLGSRVINAIGEKMHGPYTKPNFDKIRLNHYYTKSYEEHIKRAKKGKADGTTSRVLEYNPDLYSVDDDDAIKKYIPKLKEKCSI